MPRTHSGHAVVGRPNFHPTGALVWRGRGARFFASNPTIWSAPPVPAARLFVGMNVDNLPVWSLGDVITVVKAARMQQTGDPSSSFVAQKGVNRHDDGGIVEEDSAQVLIYNLSDEVDDAEFEEQMIDVATHLARVLQQELVILEMQDGGRTVKTLGVGP